MNREELIRDLKYNMEKYENDFVSIFVGTDISSLCKDVLDYLEQEPCDDYISRQSIKQKLQEHHDFFVNAYDSFGNLPKYKKPKIDEITNIIEKAVTKTRVDEITNCIAMVVNEPSVTPQPKVGHCKDCKYLEYDTWVKFNGRPLMLAHEVCKRWGDGCKTEGDGYCFLFEPQESEVKE